jgi:hypothetical protein
MKQIRYKGTSQQGPVIEEGWFFLENVVRVDYKAQLDPRGSGNAIDPMLVVTLAAGDPVTLKDVETIRKVAAELNLTLHKLDTIPSNTP